MQDSRGVRVAAIFLSVWQNDLSEEENIHNSATTYALLKRMGADIRPIFGRYKGQDEKSMMIVGPDSALTPIVALLSRKFNQESALFVTVDNDASLIFNDPNRDIERLGKLVVCSPMKAIESGEDFSIDLKNGVAFQVVTDEEYDLACQNGTFDIKQA